MAITDATWSWWIYPLTVVDGARLWVSSITEDGTNQLHRVTSQSVETVDLHDGDIDDHNAAAIAVDPDRDTLLAFYAHHNQETFVRFRSVDRETLQLGGESIVDFGATCTYAQVWQHDGSLWLLTRSPTHRWRIARTDDWGATWTTAETLFQRPAGESGQAYIFGRQRGQFVDIATVGHPTSGTWHEIGYCRVDLASEEISAADGTLIGDLGDTITLDELDTVYDPADTVRLFDVSMLNGQPAVAYAEWSDPDAAEYRVRRWSGSAWADDGLSVAAGAPILESAVYLGGMAFVDSGAWVSRESGGTWTLERRARPGWSVVETQATSPRPQVRPVVTGGALAWLDVHLYDAFTNYLSDVEVVGAPDPIAPPAPGPGLSVATLNRRIAWLGCDVATGRVIAELPDLTGRVSRLLGADASGSASTPIPLSGPGAIGPAALQATEPNRTMLVAVVNDVPAWAGWILRRDGGTSATLDLATITPEGYLGRRFVRDHTFKQVDESVVMSVLAKDAEDIDGVGQGLGLVHDVLPTGNLVDDEYLASDHATVLDRMQERSRANNGAEWTIDPEWLDDNARNFVQLVLRIAPRIGSLAGGPVFEVFDAPGGAAVEYSLAEDWSDGKGANYIVAYGVGEGDEQPVSNPAVDHPALDSGAPIVERHWQPSTSISKKPPLNRHAVAELERRRHGTRTWSVRARWDRYPHYGVDWRLGDTVRLEVVGHRHPDGVSVTARTIGWDLDLAAGIIEPKLEDV